MIKIIKSLLIVFAVGAIATGATWSYFSDTEASTGNSFTAGKIDLQVDSEAHYNGYVCALGDDGKYVWQNEIKCEETGNDLIKNGSFEAGVSLDSFATLSSGSNAITDWSVESGEVDYIGSYWPAEDGGRSVDLNGLQKGAISQTFDTVVGATYNVSFYMSGNPDSWQAGQSESYKSSSTKIMTVSATGATSIVYMYDKSLEGNTRSDMKWKLMAYAFKATSANTTLTFSSDTEGAFGPVVDNVKAPEIVCERPPIDGSLDPACDGSWDLTDLNSANKFFNFSDIKPGDYGEDTVSLHVSDNDAWGRMKIDVIKDSDGTCVDPEVAVEGDSCVEQGDNNGELRQNLVFSVWLDEGSTPGFQGKTDPGEGDNVWQNNEIQLISPGEINSGGETWNIKDAILAAYQAEGVAPGITDDGHMSPDVTYYFGIGWILPSDTGNEVQTDIFQADITFDVEQYRNNPGGFN